LKTTMKAFHRNATDRWGGIVAGLIDQASFKPDGESCRLIAVIGGV
jgi:hypothetical protein